MPSTRKITKEVQTTPPPTPRERVHWGIDTRELEANLWGMTTVTQTEGELSGREERGRSIAEVGMGVINREHDSIPGGWELI